MAIEHLNIRVYGYVQGVFFRASARETALRLGLSGMVRNEEDGSVSIEVEGESAPLVEFVQWCHQGPPSAEVERVESKPGTVKHYRGFRVAF